MASQVFYRKWRPQTLAEVVGQEHVTRTLLNALKNGQVSHAYLFCGPRGTGKTSTARVLAKAVNCLSNGKGEPCNACEMCKAIVEDRALDVIEIDAASNTGVDNIRDLREKVNYAPNQARFKVYIIDEVHMLSTSASNALLKTLEEPPPHVIFVLATTESHKVLPTILSRCQHFDFRRHSQDNVVKWLAKICQGENIQIEPPALRLIARSATGSLRDAANLLEQITTYYGSNIELKQVQDMLGITGDWRARELIKHIVNNDLSAGMATISSVSSDGLDLRQFNRELVQYLRGLLLMKTGSAEVVDLTADDSAELKALSARVSLPQILKAVKLFGQIDLSGDNSLPLELALVDCLLASGEEKEVASFRSGEVPTAKAAPVGAESAAPVKPVVPKVKPVAPKATTVPSKPVAAKEVEEPSAKPVTSSTAPAATVKGAEPSPAPQGLSSEIERLRFSWKQIVEEAPANIKKTNAIALLRSAGIKPVAIEGDVVVLSLRYSLHKENMEKPENQQVAEKLISDFLGRPCRVRCIHEPDNNHIVRAALKMGAQVTSVEEK